MKVRNEVIVLFGLLFLLTNVLVAQNVKFSDNQQTIEEDFNTPPQSAKPYVYWYWMNSNISKEGIGKDLEAMAGIGIGGVVIGNIGYKDSPVGDVTLFSDKWWDCMTFAMEEASRWGIKVELFNSPGWSGTGGPWVAPEQAMRYLDIHEYRVKGPKKLLMQLQNYETDERVRQSSLSFDYVIDKSKFKFQRVGVQAFPVTKGTDEIISSKNDKISSIPQIAGLEAMFDGDMTTNVSLFELPVTIEINTTDKFTVRSLEIVPTGIPSNFFCELEYFDDNGNRKKILKRQINRGETRIIASGFLPFCPVSESFPAVSANRFILTISENGSTKSIRGTKEEKGRIAEIRLSNAALVSNYGEKQLGNKVAYKNRSPESYGRMETGYAIKKDEVLNLTRQVDANGLLTWNVPPGEWIIQHFGMTQTGVQIHPVPQNTESGFAADVLNKKAIQHCFDSYIGQILKHIPTEKRKAFTGIVLDSYEQGTANWTDSISEKFRESYGYDPLPWLPVLKGHVVESEEQSDRFLWDLRRLIADLLPENFEGALLEKCKENGLKLRHEPYGGHGFPGEFFNFGKYNDFPTGEFWMTDKLAGNFSDCRAASSVANIYGRNPVSVESFTSASDYLYKMMPRDFKRLGDRAFTQGVNHFLFHLYIHQPDDNKPGINTWYGSEFNRNNNWFQNAKTYVDYIARCSALLQRGKRKTDIAFYIGDDVPCDKPSLPYPIPRGYDFDYVNYEVLVKLAKIENGRMVFPSGASYRLLVLPPTPYMRPELLIKLEEFVKAGLIMYGPRPVRSPGLKDFPQCDGKVREIANRLWGNIDEKIIFWNNYGTGKVCSGIDPDVFYNEAGISPDVVLPSGFIYTHREDAGSDIYFIANQNDEQSKVDISFDVAGMQPEYWDALTGRRRNIENYRVSNGRTIIPIEFSRAGSCFVVFRKERPTKGNKVENFAAYREVQNIGGSWKVKFSGNINPPFYRTFNRLEDWSMSDDKEIKYFCGKTTYSIDFSFNEKLSEDRYLNLGHVESLAKVYLNGKEVGTLWCYPYRINVSGFLRKGTNKLDIEIVNQWWNRLVGDEQAGAKITTSVSSRLFWKADDELMPSGLLGPVVLEKVSNP